MGFSDGEGLSRLYLEHVDAYKKRFMHQNGQAVLLKYSPIWKKMRKSFKALSELKVRVHSQEEAWKRGNYGCINWKRNLTFLMEKELK